MNHHKAPPLQDPAPDPTPPGALPVQQPHAVVTNYNRILVVDDDAVIHSSLAAALESDGYVVDEASNGLEAVASAARNKPNLVLLDLNMPICDGWSAFSQLGQISPLLPVIVITARPNQYPKAVQLGVDGFMEKPLNIAALIKAIKRLTIEGNIRHFRRDGNRSFVTHLFGHEMDSDFWTGN